MGETIKVRITKDRDPQGNITAVVITINKGGMIEKRRFSTEESANKFIEQMAQESNLKKKKE